MKIAVYSGASGGVVELVPSPFARLVKGYVANGRTTELCDPVPLDLLRRQLERSEIVAFDPIYAEDEDAFLQRITAKDAPADAQRLTYIDPAELPDDTFRDAWQLDAGQVTIDMEKARAIHRARLRAIRSPKLAALDIAMMRAFEDGDADKVVAIRAEKQALRDAPADPAIDAAPTPADLAAVIPEALRA
jgi:hypothetical protein